MTSGMNVALRSDITTSATPYTAGDVVGGKIQLRPGTGLSGQGTVQDVKIVDTLNQKSALTILLFKDEPTGGTYTDNAPLVLGAGDYAKLCDGGIIGIAASDYITVGGVGLADVVTQASAQWLQGTDGAVPTIWMIVVAGGTPTYGANATSLLVSLGLIAGRKP
jgi:hypothetical protein